MKSFVGNSTNDNPVPTFMVVTPIGLTKPLLSCILRVDAFTITVEIPTSIVPPTPVFVFASITDTPLPWKFRVV